MNIESKEVHDHIALTDNSPSLSLRRSSRLRAQRLLHREEEDQEEGHEAQDVDFEDDRLTYGRPRYQVQMARRAQTSSGGGAGGGVHTLSSGRGLPTEATYLVRNRYTVDTRDFEDHTFNGVMFDLRCSNNLPVKNIEIDSIWVRGKLGWMRVYITPGTCRRKEEKPEKWKEIHSKEYEPSFQKLQEMKLVERIVLQPGQSIGLYIHSADEGDEGLVYNDQRGRFTHVDRHLKIMPGLAHLSSIPFSSEAWGWVRGWFLFFYVHVNQSLFTKMHFTHS